MQKYIDQLIRDVHLAKENLQVPWIVPEEGYQLDDWISSEDDKKQATVRTVEDWSSIKQVQLPPAERLSNEQVKSLFQALKSLLEGFNCNFVVQFETPIRVQYKVMRSMWQQDHSWMSWHTNFFDVCDDNQPFGTCTFGDEYCQCKKIADYTEGWDKTIWTAEDDQEFWDKMEQRREQRNADAERQSRERHIQYLKEEFGDNYEQELKKYDDMLKDMKEQIQDMKDIDKMTDDDNWNNFDDDNDNDDFEIDF